MSKVCEIFRSAESGNW